jgi:DNA-binding GntR family transcriptional regulator
MMDSSQDNFFQRFRWPIEPGVPKYAQLRRAIISAIDQGYWRPGAKLPTELELTKLTPFSLGTVQRTLRALTDEGIIERRQGHGS